MQETHFTRHILKSTSAILSSFASSKVRHLALRFDSIYNLSAYATNRKFLSSNLRLSNAIGSLPECLDTVYSLTDNGTPKVCRSRTFAADAMQSSFKQPLLLLKHCVHHPSICRTRFRSLASQAAMDPY